MNEPRALSDRTIITRGSNIAEIVSAEATVLLPLDAIHCDAIELAGSAADVWDTISPGPATFAELKERMSNRYEIDGATLAVDLSSFVRELADHGLASLIEPAFNSRPTEETG